MRFKNLKNRGSAIILVAGILLGFLLLFFVVGIDFSRMYFVRGELQNAADAAAIAGADLLTGDDDVSSASFQQEAARQAAWKFACKNTAAQSPVYLSTNSPNDCDTLNLPAFSLLNGTTNDDTGDIIVGHWRTAPPGSVACATGWQTLGSGYFCRANGSTGHVINAVKVVAKRTGETPGMPEVGLLFPKILPWGSMGVVRTAIAWRQPAAQAPIALCQDSCPPTLTIDPVNGTLLYFAPYPAEVNPGTVGVAWTSFNATSQQTEKDVIMSILCGAEKDACGLTVYTSNSNDNSLQRQFRCAFLNPLYNSNNKTCADGSCDSASDTVTSWKVVVPVFQSPNGCPPGDQPQPETVVKYGLMTVTQIYASGGGGTNECACGAFDAPKLTGSQPNAIRITQLECVDCTNPEFLGSKATLVK